MSEIPPDDTESLLSEIKRLRKSLALTPPDVLLKKGLQIYKKEPRKTFSYRWIVLSAVLRNDERNLSACF
jgi:hypothetical protein